MPKTALKKCLNKFKIKKQNKKIEYITVIYADIKIILK